MQISILIKTAHELLLIKALYARKSSQFTQFILLKWYTNKMQGKKKIRENWKIEILKQYKRKKIKKRRRILLMQLLKMISLKYAIFPHQIYWRTNDMRMSLWNFSLKQFLLLAQIISNMCFLSTAFFNNLIVSH